MTLIFPDFLVVLLRDGRDPGITSVDNTHRDLLTLEDVKQYKCHVTKKFRIDEKYKNLVT